MNNTSARKPLIAISNDFYYPQTQPAPSRFLSCPAAYANAVAAAGGIPVVTGEQCPEELPAYFDGLILTGGSDVSPSLYGEEIRFPTVKPDPTRDAFEAPLAQAFLKTRKPILAVCRGFQLLNVVLGGTLYQDLPEELGFVHFDRALRHYVEAEEGSALHALFGRRFRVNSTHHQAVKELGDGLFVTARSLEGVVEAYEHRTLPILGCQFHPERISLLTDDRRTPDFLPLFERFVGMCGE